MIREHSCEEQSEITEPPVDTGALGRLDNVDESGQTDRVGWPDSSTLSSRPSAPVSTGGSVISLCSREECSRITPSRSNSGARPWVDCCDCRGFEPTTTCPPAGRELLEFLGPRFYRCAVACVRAYGEPSTGGSAVVNEISERFDDARRILNTVTDQYLFPSGSGGSAWAERRLPACGRSFA